MGPLNRHSGIEGELAWKHRFMDQGLWLSASKRRVPALDRQLTTTSGDAQRRWSARSTLGYPEEVRATGLQARRYR